MHYIRFLKPPRIVSAQTTLHLSAKITVTTDLGESTLLANKSVVVALEYGDGTEVPGISREYVWKGRDGMRSLEVIVPVPLSTSKRKIGWQMVNMLIRSKEENFAVETFQRILAMPNQDNGSGDLGGVVAVRSAAIDISPKAIRDTTQGLGMAQRIFTIGSGRNEERVRIWEETGESIARHIWDAGLVFSSYFASLSTANPRATSRTPKLPILEMLLHNANLNILELGAGCGIVGITLASSLSHFQKFILTDLPEASPILMHNLSLSTLHLSNISSQVLDWSSSLPPNIALTSWDLVLVADCTYNPDVVPDLVRTLKCLASGNGENGKLLAALAMKVRHPSEMVFFELMRESGFVVREDCKILLPMLGGAVEKIEFFVFGYGL